MEKGKKVILYSRVSSTDQKDHGYSLNDQQTRLESYCRSEGFEILRSELEDASAKNFDRPKFQSLLEFLKKNRGVVDQILFVRWDRFSRNASDAYEMIRILKKLGVEVNAVEQKIDWKVPEQKIMLSIYLATPEVENDRKSINVVRGMRRANMEGRYLGQAPRGYSNSKDIHGKPILLPNEKSKFFQEAFELYATGLYTQEEIRIELNNKGLNCPKSQFAVLMQNKLYAGYVKIKAYENNPEQWIKGIHQALVEEGVFNRVQDILNHRRVKTNRLKVKMLDPNLPLRGFLVCGKCGNNLTGSASSGNGGRYYYYHCNACSNERFRADLINNQMEELLNEFQIKPEVTKLYMAIIRDELKTSTEQRQSEEKQRISKIKMLNERIRRITDAMSDGHMKPFEYGKERDRYQNEIDVLKLKGHEIKGMNTEFEEYLKWGFCLMENIKVYYKNADVQIQQKIIGSIFPEKFIFSEGKCRTKRVNELVAMITTTGAEFRDGKAGPFQNFLKQPGLVPRAGVEPACQ